MNSRDPNALPTGVMPDVQRSVDKRNLPIQQVGIRGLRYPLQWQGRDQVHPSVAQIGMFVALPADQKGTHMSRFTDMLELQQEPFSLAEVSAFFVRMLKRLEAKEGQIEFEMPFFMRKHAPVSGVTGLMDYQLKIKVSGTADRPVVEQTVAVPVTSLCPCSKSISDYGAHNQRSLVTVSVRPAADADANALSPEALVEAIEAQASSQLYGQLKRTDEKFVTEYAYDNPKFVEDLIRDVALAVVSLGGIDSYCVEGENFESIHNHSAYAKLTG